MIEFRNVQWLREDFFDWLRDLRLGFCCVDGPQLPRLLRPLAEVTSNTGSVPFHGRNRAKWWLHEHAYEVYDYGYSPSELSEWLLKIWKLDKIAERNFVFANNHWRRQLIQFANCE